MVVRRNKFQALCINNKYQDFGNHTGFQYRACTFDHLIVGEWYNFEKSSFGHFDLVINGRKPIGTGYGFGVGSGYVPEHVDFYKFFSTIQEQRDMKLNILI